MYSCCTYNSTKNDKSSTNNRPPRRLKHYRSSTKGNGSNSAKYLKPSCSTNSSLPLFNITILPFYHVYLAAHGGWLLFELYSWWLVNEDGISFIIDQMIPENWGEIFKKRYQLVCHKDERGIPDRRGFPDRTVQPRPDSGHGAIFCLNRGSVRSGVKKTGRVGNGVVFSRCGYDFSVRS